MTEEKKRLIIIDSNSIIHRAYHALPALTSPRGELVNAVYGFLLVFFRVLKEIQPDYIAAVFDFPAPCFRHEKFPGYKSKRPKAPEELYQQIPRVKEILTGFQVPIFEKQGFEADDLIATISQRAVQRQIYPELDVYIVSGDSDVLQFINKKVKVYVLGRGLKETLIYDEEKVKERFGLSSEQLKDFKALAGDPTDNIPGASGIGKKTATKLLQGYKDIDNLYQSIEQGEAGDIGSRTKDILLENKEQVLLSRSLVEAQADASFDFTLEKCLWKRYNKKKVEELFIELDFQSLIKRLP